MLVLLVAVVLVSVAVVLLVVAVVLILVVQVLHFDEKLNDTNQTYDLQLRLVQLLLIMHNYKS